jgi:nucleoside-diphosphate-sugar epimerase
MTPTVLVTGGQGTMGPWVVRALHELGAQVVVLDLLDRPRSSLGEAGAVPDESIVGDVRDTALVRSVLGEYGVSHLVHLAAIVGEECERDPVTALEVNTIATARLIAAAEGAGVTRLVANSTKGVLGPLPERYLHPTYDPVPIDHPPSPRQIYEVSKLGVERLVVAARARGLHAATLRFTTTWGPGKSAATHAGLSFHSDLVAAAMTGGEVRVDVHPEQGFDLIYYADVGAAIAAAALVDRPLTSHVYHVGAGRLTRMREFAAAVERAFPGCHVTMGERFPPGRNVLFDIEAARRDLGYVPAFDVAAALADIAERAGISTPPMTPTT